MADFRLRIGFAKTDAATWLSHLEVVRAMERCVRRSGLPYAVSQGFNPHLKHSFSAALPVGTGSLGEYMDVELSKLVEPSRALAALQAVQHEFLPVQAAYYVSKSEPSLQLALNYASYDIVIEDPHGTIVPKLLNRLRTTKTLEVTKKGKPKTYDLSLYVVEYEACEESDGGAVEDLAAVAAESSDECLRQKDCKTRTMQLSLLSRPEGSLRPEVILKTLAGSDLNLNITSLTRTALKQQAL